MSTDEETRLAGELFRIATPVYKQSEGYFSNNSNLPVKTAYTRWTANHTNWDAGKTVQKSIQDELGYISIYGTDTGLHQALTTLVGDWGVALDDLSKGSTDTASQAISAMNQNAAGAVACLKAAALNQIDMFD